MLSTGPYTKAEDQLLLEVVAALIRRRSLSSGPHPATALDEGVDVSWVAVAGYMKGRTDSSVRSRYRTLVKGNVIHRQCTSFSTVTWGLCGCPLGMDRDPTRSLDTVNVRRKRVLPSLSKRSIKSKLRKTDFHAVLRVTAVGTVGNYE